MSDKITIRKAGMMICEIERSNLISAEQTHDGIVFTLKNSVQIYCTDGHMPLVTKNLIENAVSSFPTANLVFELNNYKKPVIVEPTKTAPKK